MMDDPERVILDISSDEEVGFVGSRGTGGGGVGGGAGGGGSDNYDWITELLDEGDGRKNDDSESDDVVVVGEVIVNPKQNLKSLATSKAIEDDDDCVVLEEDPDKPVEVENDKGVDDDSDDVLVVSEKGQIACRDYPHPRHDCAKFPFSSTPHDRHCDQCHCYVCDTIAPCAFWNIGISSVAHCHATDKDKYWKVQRQSTRKSDKAFPLVPTCPDTSVYVPPPVANQAHQARLPHYYPSQNQMIRQAPIRPCSMTNSRGLPNLARQQVTATRDKFHSHVVSQQLRNASINVNPRDKRLNAGRMSPQFFTTRTAFKRPGSSGLGYTYNSSNTSSVSHLGRTDSSVPCVRVPVGSNNYFASSQPNAGMPGTNVVSCQPQLHRQPGLTSVPANYAPTQPQISSHPNAGMVGANAVSAFHQLTRQPSLVRASANYAPMEPHMPTQSVLGANFQPQLARQPSLASISTNYVPVEPGMPSQTSAGICGTNTVSFQPKLPRQSGLVSVSADCAPMEPQLPSQPHVSVCANSASLGAPVFPLQHPTSSSTQPLLSSLPSILSEFESFIASESIVSSQSQDMYNNPLAPETKIHSQSYADRNSANSLPQQTSVGFQPEGGNTSIGTTASQYLLACPTNAGTTLGDSTTSHDQLSNQPDGECQPDIRGQQISALSDNQHVSQHGYQSEDALGSSFEDFDFGWGTHVSQTNSLDNVNNPKPAESQEVSRYSHLTESATEMDDWLFSGPLEAGYNILSPEVPAIDSGFFVDF